MNENYFNNDKIFLVYTGPKRIETNAESQD